MEDHGVSKKGWQYLTHGRSDERPGLGTGTDQYDRSRVVYYYYYYYYYYYGELEYYFLRVDSNELLFSI